MTADEIRAEAIERVARAQYEDNTTDVCGWDSEDPYVQKVWRISATRYVDALGDLLPTGAEQGSWSDQPLQRRYVTDWRPVDA